MGRLRRIDSELVRRSLAESRGQAAEYIRQGLVYLDGQVVVKPSRQINPAQALVVKKDQLLSYASRGGFKLAGVLEVLGERAPLISGRRCLDAGASTGGFTDVLLRNGAAQVLAVDVGYGQLRWELQQDKRVVVHDRTNIRYLQLEQIGEPVDLVVSDLSFISLTLVLDALVRCSLDNAQFLLMVKPQFEIGKELVPSSGVVKNPDHHCAAVMGVIQAAWKLGLKLLAVEASPLPGPSGNVEYFVLLDRGEEGFGSAQENLVGEMVREAIKRGPDTLVVEKLKNSGVDRLSTGFEGELSEAPDNSVQ